MTDPPTTQSGSQAKRDFHIVLSLVLLPVITLPVAWIIYILRLVRSRTDAREQGWLRALAGLTVLDTVLMPALLVLAFYSPASIKEKASQAPTGRRPFIGINFQPEDKVPGCVVSKVMPGLPAARGGLKVGDRIVKIGDDAVAGCAQVRSSVARGPTGRPRPFEIKRGARSMALRITPRLINPRRHAPPPPGLFETTVPCDADSGGADRSLPWGYLAVLVALLIIVGCGRRRGRKPLMVGAATICFLVGYQLLFVLAAPIMCWLLGGHSTGGFLVMMNAGTATGLVVAVAFQYPLRRAGALEVPEGAATLSTARALGQALWYLLAGGFRLAILAAIINAVLPMQEGGLLETVARFSFSSGGATFLFLSAVVVLGPVAEEVFFRGLLLPWISSWLGWRPALAITSLAFALVHTDYGIHRQLLVCFLGILLGWIRIRTGSLRGAIILHMMVNSVGSLSVLMR